jgi:hypothetical protein
MDHVDVPARREPNPELSVAVQEHLPLGDREDRYREVPTGSLGDHTTPGYTSDHFQIDLPDAAPDVDVEGDVGVAVSVVHVGFALPR